jgi:hypothetical protein
MLSDDMSGMQGHGTTTNGEKLCHGEHHPEEETIKSGKLWSIQ